MKIVVTGAAGFIGAHLCKQLINDGHSITGIDNFSSYYSRDLKESRLKALLTPDSNPIEELDIKDFKKLLKLLTSLQPDLVIHLSAQAGVRLPLDEIDTYVLENNLGHINVSKAVVELGIPNLIYASSSSVYGNANGLILNEDQSATHPISVYGVSKLANENFTHAISKSSNLKAIGLRFFTVYGPWGRPDMAYFRLINSSLNGDIFPLMGKGTVIRDFTYIDDVTYLISRIADYINSQTSVFSTILNIGGGSPTSLTNMIAIVHDLTERNPKIKHLSRNMGDVDSTWCDKTKLESVLGPHNFINLEAGLMKTLEWATEIGVQAKLPEWVKSIR